MKLLLMLLAASTAFGAGWDSVQRIPLNHKVEITTQDGRRTNAAFVSATGDAMVIREASGDKAVKRTEIRQVRVYDRSRRIRNGIIWTAVGAAAGAVIGEVACVSCPNEGHGYKYVGPGLAAGAGIGALNFLRSSYRTVYKSK